jgi:hypothetical protein
MEHATSARGVDHDRPRLSHLARRAITCLAISVVLEDEDLIVPGNGRQ